MEINRTYKNYSDAVIRIDYITMSSKGQSFYNPIANTTYQRHLKTILYHNSGDANRTVSTIEVEGDYSSIETDSGNFLYADWIKPVAKVDMSDLPKVGDTA